MDGSQALTEDLVCEIESKDFADLAHMASGERSFVRMVAGNMVFQRLATAARSPSAQGQIIRRIRYLSEADIDHRYENRWDSALSAYLLSMMLVGDDLGYVAGLEARRAPNAWFLDHILAASHDGLLAPREMALVATTGTNMKLTISGRTHSLNQWADAATLRAWPLQTLYRSVGLPTTDSATIASGNIVPEIHTSDSSSIQASS